VREGERRRGGGEKGEGEEREEGREGEIETVTINP
jgi:hypothetical protein